MTSSNTLNNTFARGVCDTGILPVVVRFVPYDQWFVTHVALSWTIAQVKSWILAKCFHDSDTLRILSASLDAAADKGKARKRKSISPITFASRRLTIPALLNQANGDDGSDDVGFYDSDDDRHPLSPLRISRQLNPYIPQSRGVDSVSHPPPSSVSPRPSVSSQTSSPPAQPTDYSLLSFSTSLILEDRYPVSWYSIRPHELLEVHPSGSIIRFSRDISTDTLSTLTATARTRTISGSMLGVSPKDALPSSKGASGLSEYIQPYFQAPVKALRIVRQHASFSPQFPGSTQGEVFPPVPASPSFLRTGKRLKSTRPGNNYNTNFTSTTGEAVEIDANEPPSDLIGDQKEPAVTNDFNSYIEASTTEQLPNSRHKVTGTANGGRTKLIWQDRWVIIRDGVLNLCERKEDITNASHSSQLSSLLALRGSEYLVNNPSVSGKFAGSGWRNDASMKKRIVCIKFQTQQALGRKGSSVSFSERDSREFDRKGKKAHHITGPSDNISNSDPSAGSGNSGERDKEDHCWLIIDMINEIAFEHVIRVLHRLAPQKITSSFLDQAGRSSDPSPFSLMAGLSQTSIQRQSSVPSLRQSYHTASSSSERIEPSVTSSSPPASSLSAIHEAHKFSLSINTSGAVLRPDGWHDASRSCHEGLKNGFALKYPDWRSDAVIRAQRAGLGDVGKGMGFLHWGDVGGLDEQEAKDSNANRTSEEKKRSLMFKSPKGVWNQNFNDSEKVKIGSSNHDSEDFDRSTDEDSCSDDEDIKLSSSETEWEGWKQDLRRKWISITEEPRLDSFLGDEKVDFSGYRLGARDDDFVRRRTRSDVDRPLSPLSSTMTNLSAVTSDDSILWRPLLRPPGVVTTSTVSIGRSSMKKRPPMATWSHAQTGALGQKSVAKGKWKQKEENRGPLWSRLPIWQMLHTESTHVGDAGTVGSDGPSG